MAKKRKLNSKNPAYNKDIAVEQPAERKRVLVREVKGCQIYHVWYA